MICEKCFKEVDENDKYCRHCGNILLHTDAEGENVALTALRSVCGSALFFTICILMTVKLACDLAAPSLPIVEALIVIFLWLIYSSAKNNALKSSDLEKIDKAINLEKILLWVNVGIIAVILVLLFTFGEKVITYYQIQDLPIIKVSGLLAYLPNSILENVNLILTVCIIFTIFILVGLVIYNLTFVSKLKKFVLSLLSAIKSGSLADIQEATAIKKWLYIIATFQAVYALRAFDSLWQEALGATVKCAATIIAAIIIKETLIERNDLQ